MLGNVLLLIWQLITLHHVLAFTVSRKDGRPASGQYCTAALRPHLVFVEVGGGSSCICVVQVRAIVTGLFLAALFRVIDIVWTFKYADIVQ